MRVLMEAAPLAWATLAGAHRTGIPRYIVELLQQFAQEESGVEATLGVWDDDVIACAVAPRILERWPDLVQRLSNGYKSRFHLDRVYRRLMSGSNAPPEDGLSWELLSAASRLVKALDRKRQRANERFDLYHSPHVVLSMHEDLERIPRVLTVHDLLPITHPHFFTRQIVRDFEKLLRRLDPRRDSVICDSQETRRSVLAVLGVSPERCWHVPLAPSEKLERVGDPGRLEAVLGRWGLEPNRYLLTVGTLEPRKNLLHLLRCHAELERSGDVAGWKLVVVGRMGWGGIPEEIRRLVAAAGGGVVLSGPVSDEELSALYTGAGLFVYVPIAEGFGLPPLEAMRCGAPVVTSDCSALPEVVGDAAVLVDPTDPAALGAALRRLVGDEAERSALRLEGMARAEQFSWRRTAELTREAYQRASESA